MDKSGNSDLMARSADYEDVSLSEEEEPVEVRDVEHPAAAPPSPPPAAAPAPAPVTAAAPASPPSDPDELDAVSGALTAPAASDSVDITAQADAPPTPAPVTEVPPAPAASTWYNPFNWFSWSSAPPIPPSPPSSTAAPEAAPEPSSAPEAAPEAASEPAPEPARPAGASPSALSSFTPAQIEEIIRLTNEHQRFNAPPASGSAPGAAAADAVAAPPPPPPPPPPPAGDVAPGGYVARREREREAAREAEREQWARDCEPDALTRELGAVYEDFAAAAEAREMAREVVGAFSAKGRLEQLLYCVREHRELVSKYREHAHPFRLRVMLDLVDVWEKGVREKVKLLEVEYDGEEQPTLVEFVAKQHKRFVTHEGKYLDLEEAKEQAARAWRAVAAGYEEKVNALRAADQSKKMGDVIGELKSIHQQHVEPTVVIQRDNDDYDL